MTTQFDLNSMSPEDRQDYGYARARDAAFEAIHTLWKQRQTEGMKQKDLAEAIAFSPSRLSRSLKGPGNWTLRTLGALAEGMQGQIYISVVPLEKPLQAIPNHNAYTAFKDLRTDGQPDNSKLVFVGTTGLSTGSN